MSATGTKYDFAVYGTQGGGLVRWVNGAYIFVEPPKDFPEFTAGSVMPSEWGIAVANDEALREMNEAADFDHGVDEFFDLAFTKVERGEMTLKQVGGFIDIARRNTRQ